MKAPMSVRSLLVTPHRYSRCTPLVRVAIAQPAPYQQFQQRSFFSLADVAKLLPTAQAQQRDGDDYEDPNSQKFHARKILPYTQEQLYNIVADVPSYSKFIPFCASSSVVASPTSATPAQGLQVSREPFDVEAELQVGFGNFSEKYTSRVQGVPFESVTATVKDSPLFHNLHSTYSPAANATVTSPSDGPTMLTIDLSFSFASPLHRMASQAFLPKVQDMMVEAFEKRCLQVYGKGKV
ncbi:hypothetical protein QFC22_002257 [Naganishia vaughanmartiniae]|uniref:Uncharacterized protein n=1 Tax=Naganishia vaughanmartiniae TaxID=1424756 RepID=A0ACC2XFZ0_9TREE|nr:hypothetical protein QFC22_002257 [Naganishia vaughanmartiniae]